LILPFPAITRKTDKGLPRYCDVDESDVFILSGVEDLVPVLRSGGTRFEDDKTFPGYVIHRYCSCIEGRRPPDIDEQRGSHQHIRAARTKRGG
jgi:hypothetical protein